jgi:hypothetical protein
MIAVKGAPAPGPGGPGCFSTIVAALTLGLIFCTGPVVAQPGSSDHSPAPAAGSPTAAPIASAPVAFPECARELRQACRAS